MVPNSIEILGEKIEKYHTERLQSTGLPCCGLTHFCTPGKKTNVSRERTRMSSCSRNKDVRDRVFPYFKTQFPSSLLLSSALFLRLFPSRHKHKSCVGIRDRILFYCFICSVNHFVTNVLCYNRSLLSRVYLHSLRVTPDA